MARQRGGSKKLKRSGKKKGYFNNFRLKYSGKLIRRRADREKRLAAAQDHPEIGSPSQLRTRQKTNKNINWALLRKIQQEETTT